jgi:hypothetical protein
MESGPRGLPEAAEWPCDDRLAERKDRAKAREKKTREEQSFGRSSTKFLPKLLITIYYNPSQSLEQ